MGRILIAVGIIVLILGLLIQFTNFNLNWFGDLPGDIKIEKPGFSLYIPITSMLIISAIISIILWLINKFNF